MNTQFFRLLIVALVFNGASGCFAATVTYRLEQNALGEFRIFARASNDNFGISKYSIPLQGPITSFDHLSPKADFASGPGGNSPVGFTVFRTADGGGSNITVVGGQDTIGNPAGNLIRGFGQEASSFLEKGIVAIAGAEQPNWSVPLLLAVGTYDPTQGRISINTSSVDLLGGVFISESGRQSIPAIIAVVPEPGTVIPVVVALAAFLTCGRSWMPRRFFW